MDTVHKGLSILNAKNLAMMEYNIRIKELYNYKINNSALDVNCVNRLVKLRLILEKCQVIEKLQSYRISKLIKQSIEVDDEMMLKPELSDFKIEKSETYKPPKIAKVQFEDKEYKSDKKEKKRSKLANSRILQDMQMEYDDKPEEMMADGTSMYTFDKSSNKAEKKIKALEEAEEEQFLRISRTKQDKRLYKERNRGLLNDELKGLQDDFKILQQVQEVEISDKSRKRVRSSIEKEDKDEPNHKSTKFMNQRKRNERW